MQTLCLATRNPHKTAELQAILGGAWQVSDASQRADLPEVEETGATFQENAALKAVAISERVPGWVLADDSGLEVDALGGDPGVFSARYAGVDATSDANNRKLLAELDRIGARSLPERRGRFQCVLALAQAGKVLEFFPGTCEGAIIFAPSGEGGFGYDSLFLPNGFDETFWQMPVEIKNQISHRGRALAAFLEWSRSTKAATAG